MSLRLFTVHGLYASINALSTVSDKDDAFDYFQLFVWAHDEGEALALAQDDKARSPDDEFKDLSAFEREPKLGVLR